MHYSMLKIKYNLINSELLFLLSGLYLVYKREKKLAYIFVEFMVAKWLQSQIAIKGQHVCAIGSNDQHFWSF